MGGLIGVFVLPVLVVAVGWWGWYVLGRVHGRRQGYAVGHSVGYAAGEESRRRRDAQLDETVRRYNAKCLNSITVPRTPPSTPPA